MPSSSTFPIFESGRPKVLETGNGLTSVPRTSLRYSLVVVIPVFYNADSSGKRRPIEQEKLAQTEAEIKGWFEGYTSYPVSGWYRSEAVDAGCTDRNILYTIDAPADQFDIDTLRHWRRLLEARFEQERIYMTITGPILEI